MLRHLFSLLRRMPTERSMPQAEKEMPASINKAGLNVHGKIHSGI